MLAFIKNKLPLYNISTEICEPQKPQHFKSIKITNSFTRIITSGAAGQNLSLCSPFTIISGVITARSQDRITCARRLPGTASDCYHIRFTLSHKTRHLQLNRTLGQVPSNGPPSNIYWQRGRSTWSAEILGHSTLKTWKSTVGTRL